MIDYALLGLLREQPDYGYRLKQRFEARMGTVWSLNIGQVYQTLRHLERRGLVVETAMDRSDGRRVRRLLDITPKGRRALERWLVRQPAQFRPVRDETLVRLLLLAPSEHATAADQLSKLEASYRQLLARLAIQHRDAEDDREALVHRLGIEAARLHTEAHLAWIDHCRRYLDAVRPGDSGACAASG